MSEAEERITDAELEVMGALWRGEGPMTLSQVKEAMARARGWNGDTTKTLLRRLCRKGAVEQEKREVYYYRPLVSRENFGRYKTMVAALVERQALKREDVGELRAMFDALWEEKGGGET